MNGSAKTRTFVQHQPGSQEIAQNNFPAISSFSRKIAISL